MSPVIDKVKEEIKKYVSPDIFRYEDYSVSLKDKNISGCVYLYKREHKLKLSPIRVNYSSYEDKGVVTTTIDSYEFTLGQELKYIICDGIISANINNEGTKKYINYKDYEKQITYYFKDTVKSWNRIESDYEKHIEAFKKIIVGTMK